MKKSEVLELLLTTDTFRNAVESQSPVLKSRELDFGFIFNDIIEGTHTEIIIGFEKSFPLTAPSFFIQKFETYPHIPHAESDGKICYTHEDYLFLDRSQPKEIIHLLYQTVRAIIAKGLLKENWIDFTNEYESYWGKIKGAEEILSNIDIGSEATILKVGTHDKFKVLVSETNDSLQSIRRFINFQGTDTTFKNVLYIPLTPAQPLIPPPYTSTIGVDFVKTLVAENTDKETRKRITQLSPKCTASGIVIFSFSLPNGNDVLFGVRFTKTSGEHPLLAPHYDGKIIPLQLHRLDKKYLYRRGGSGELTVEKRGLIVGCGSVGGFMAEELVRNGFMKLTVVDDDLFSFENCYRHILGFTAIGKNKALAIKEKIERSYPHSYIDAMEDRIEDLISSKKINFKNFDFIIVATGNVTINSYLNDLVYRAFPGIPTLYAWNDPYGIGGHCLITNIKRQGCYQCLYEEDTSHNAASFADKDQPKTFLKTISGCGGTYTPYGAIASQRTSILTVSKVIHLIKGNEVSNSIFSWKGDSDVFLNEGYRLSPRFYMSDEELLKSKAEFVYEQCLVCSKES